jgi:hypothetical protein
MFMEAGGWRVARRGRRRLIFSVALTKHGGRKGGGNFLIGSVTGEEEGTEDGPDSLVAPMF